MPGLTITLSRNKCNAAHPIAKDFPNYQSQVFEQQKYCISAYYPEEYPIQSFENQYFKIIIEGYIFSKKSSLEHELFEIAKERFSNKQHRLLEQFIKSTDGEYIVCMIEKSSQKLLLFNDYLARLPFYYYYTKDAIVLSREISFLTHYASSAIDPMAKAEVMMFGFTLGRKTLHKNCFKLLPSQSIFIDDHNVVSIQSYVHFNFEHQNNHITFEEAVSKSVGLFEEATRLRAQKAENHTLSLSGGLDSRAVLAALDQSKCPYSAITYEHASATPNADVRVAKALAKAYNTPLKHHILQEPSDQDADVLSKIKQGLNDSGMSFLLPFFRSLEDTTALFWTGDGGDKIFPDLRPLRHLFSENDLVNYIYKKHHNFTYKEIENTTGISKSELKSHLKNHLKQYPETRWSGKYVHFIIMERGVNWLFEGEDRNRYFVRSITPFYAVPLFQFCMSLPSPYKKDYKLFRAFLNRLDPKLNQIDNANWDTSLNHTYKIKWIYFKQTVKAYLSIFRTFDNAKPNEKATYLKTLEHL